VPEDSGASSKGDDKDSRYHYSLNFLGRVTRSSRHSRQVREQQETAALYSELSWSTILINCVGLYVLVQIVGRYHHQVTHLSELDGTARNVVAAAGALGFGFATMVLMTCMFNQHERKISDDVEKLFATVAERVGVAVIVGAFVAILSVSVEAHSVRGSLDVIDNIARLSLIVTLFAIASCARYAMRVLLKMRYSSGLTKLVIAGVTLSIPLFVADSIFSLIAAGVAFPK
jgi:hypothetical protein